MFELLPCHADSYSTTDIVKLNCFAKPNQRRGFAKLNLTIKSTEHETGVTLKQENEISNRTKSYVSFGAVHK